MLRSVLTLLLLHATAGLQLRPAVSSLRSSRAAASLRSSRAAARRALQMAAKDVQMVWLTGAADLRLGDQEGFARAAAAGGSVLPVYVLDPDLLSCKSEDTLRWLHVALTGLYEALGGRLVVRSGSSAEVLYDLARECDADTCYFIADDPAARLRATQRAVAA